MGIVDVLADLNESPFAAVSSCGVVNIAMQPLALLPPAAVQRPPIAGAA
jgi:hypothetical protein